MRRLEDWIEYMEGEGAQKWMGQLGLLLKHSIADQVVLDNLRRLRRLIKKTDLADKINDTISNVEFLSGMHAKVMVNITAAKSVTSKRHAREKSLSPGVDQGPSQESCSN
jgi:hypothetical protein